MIRVWHQWKAQNADNPDKPNMWHLQEFFDATKAMEFICNHADNFSDYLITENQVELKVSTKTIEE